MITGIYGIFETKSNECLYVGQSKDIENRYKGHCAGLTIGNHIRTEFVDWFNENGADLSIIYMKILEKCEDDINIKNELEIKWFNELKPKFYAHKPSSKQTWVADEKTRKKISERSKKPRQYDEKIIDLYVNENKSLSEISEIVPMSRDGIMKALKRNDVEMKPNGFQSSIVKKNIENTRNPGRHCYMCGTIMYGRWDKKTCSHKCRVKLNSIHSSLEFQNREAQRDWDKIKIEVNDLYYNENYSLGKLIYEYNLNRINIKELLNIP